MENPVFELGVNLIETCMILWFLTEYLGSKFEGLKQKLGFTGFWLLYFLELSFINYIIPFEGLLGFIPVIIYFLYALCFLKGSWGQKLFISIFAQAIVAMVAISTTFVVSFISHVTVSGIITDFSAERVFMVVTTKVVQFYLFCIILQIKENTSLQLRGWTLLVCLPVLTLASMVFLMESALIAPEISRYVFMASGILVVINFLTLYFVNRIAADQEKQREYDLMKQQQDSIKQSEENLIALFETTNSMRHDLNEHLLVIHTMIQNGETAKAVAYIQGIMKNTANPQKEFVRTSNYLLNALINVKLELCVAKDIKTCVTIEDVSFDFMQTEDMVTLFGNLFNNAIEAAEQTEEKYLRFSMQRQGEYLSVFMENSAKVAVLSSNKKLTTTKADKKLHGFGIKNISKVVQRYNGIIEFYDDNKQKRFCCDILLKPTSKEENNTNHA